MCIFCSIVKGDIPNYTIYEDETVLAFLDVNPTSYGHTLVIPKEHYDSFLECPEQVRNHVFEVAQKIANKMEEVLKCDGINLLSNIHEPAGQSVHHFHVHLIPRYIGKDTVTIAFNPIEPVNYQEIIDVLKF